MPGDCTPKCLKMPLKRENKRVILHNYMAAPHRSEIQPNNYTSTAHAGWLLLESPCHNGIQQCTVDERSLKPFGIPAQLTGTALGPTDSGRAVIKDAHSFFGVVVQPGTALFTVKPLQPKLLPLSPPSVILQLSSI
jgi:hypothetical protein